MRDLLSDRRGFAFSLDVLLALIPLTILLGMLAADMDNIMYLTQSTIYQSSLDRQASDIADAWLNHQGLPLTGNRRGTPRA